MVNEHVVERVALLTGRELVLLIEDDPDIREIIKYNSLTRVPMMPEFMQGVINLRGNVVPIVILAVASTRRDVSSSSEAPAQFSSISG